MPMSTMSTMYMSTMVDGQLDSIAFLLRSKLEIEVFVKA